MATAIPDAKGVKRMRRYIDGVMRHYGTVNRMMISPRVRANELLDANVRLFRYKLDFTFGEEIGKKRLWRQSIFVDVSRQAETKWKADTPTMKST
ncbi:MAG: hypothetical protein IPJ28_01265 [Betaproteobacteria bacterium]|nr:hypothetical protein [Betaproteobacteria bacterium]